MTNINITEQGVYKLLKNQKPHKATGPESLLVLQWCNSYKFLALALDV
jgi:sulfur relay (sulfurtransferase) DsrF/TusC family protein